MNLRQPPIRSQKLRRAAKGQRCTMNLPGICTDDPETVVLAHIHDETFGRGQKADDTSGAHMCHACHTAYDLHRTGLEDGDLYRMLLRAMQRTIRRLVVDLKVIIVPLDPEHLSHERPTPPRKPPEQRKAVAWRYRYEETGEDNEMIWSDWIVVKWKPNRSVFSTKVEIEPLAPLSGGGGKDNTTNSTGDTAEQRVTDEAIDRAIKAYCDEPSNDMRDMMRAALSTMGGKP